MRPLALLIGATWVVINGVNALNKGGDLSDYLDAGTRFLAGRPLYEASGVAAGLVGPPFQPVLFVPFALIAGAGDEIARLSWYLVNVLSLGVGLYAWHTALTAVRPPQFATSPSTMVWPLLAVFYPLQTNFEHQNINAVLLAMSGLGALREVKGRSIGAGFWLGAAAALKVFRLGLCLAVLLSPIAWEHYWLLLWPVFAIAYAPPAGSSSWVRAAFWVGSVLTSGVVRPTVGRAGLAIARGLSARTWAGLIVLSASLAAFRTLHRGRDYHVSIT